MNRGIALPTGAAWVSLWTMRRDFPGFANRHQRRRRPALRIVTTLATQDWSAQ